MFEFITNPEERGQVGIGTLIVFIAMVLVAAIAAGVLINTAGFLQTQAEETGQDSTDLVSERIDVSSEVGIVAGTENTLSEIRLEVTGAPGADQIDLAETTIQAVGPGGQENLVFTENSDVTALETSDVTTSSNTIDITSVDAQAFVDAYDAIDNTNDPVDVTLTVEYSGGDQSQTLSGIQVNSLESQSFDLSSSDFDNNDAPADGETVTLEISQNGGGSTIDTTSVTTATSAPNPLQLTAPGGESVQGLSANQFAVGSDGNFRSSAVLSDEDDFTILINPGAGAFDDSGAFGEGESATLDIVSPAGATTQVELRAPDLFNTQGEAVRL